MARIILAEDDKSLRRFLAKALAKAGHQVTDVGDGSSALDAMREGGYDLLIADIVMPGVDGIEVARRAVLSLPELRVMFITGFAAVALNGKGLAPKETRVLSKPFHLRDLVDEVDRILAA